MWWTLWGLRSKSPDRREAAVRKLATSADQSAFDAITSVLEDPSTGVRTAVVEALANVGHSKALETIIRLVDDTDPGVRLAVIRALAKLNDERAEGVFLKASHDASIEVADHAKAALLLLEERQRLAAARRILQQRQAAVVRAESDDRMREAAVKSERASIDSLIALTVVKGDDRALSALAESQEPAIVECLIEAFRDSKYTGKDYRIVSALGKLGPVAVEPLIQALGAKESYSGQVRKGAAEALGIIRDKRAVEPLIAVLSSADYDRTRAAAAEALGRIKDASDVDALVEGLSSSGTNLPDKCAWALGELRDARAVEALVRKLQGSLIKFDSSLKRRILEALARIEDSAAIPAIIWIIEQARPELTKPGSGNVLPLAKGAVSGLISILQRRASDTSVEALRSVAALEELAYVEWAYHRPVDYDRGEPDDRGWEPTGREIVSLASAREIASRELSRRSVL